MCIRDRLIVGALIAIYVLYVTVIFFKNAFSKNFKDKNYSRTVSSYWGLCGIFGFLGFSGFWTYFEYGDVYKRQSLCPISFPN